MNAYFSPVIIGVVTVSVRLVVLVHLNEPKQQDSVELVVGVLIENGVFHAVCVSNSMAYYLNANLQKSS